MDPSRAHAKTAVKGVAKPGRTDNNQINGDVFVGYAAVAKTMS